MLSSVGCPVAINPDGALRSHAKAQGWPIRDYRIRGKESVRRGVPAAAAAGDAAPADPAVAAQGLVATEPVEQGGVVRSGDHDDVGAVLHERSDVLDDAADQLRRRWCDILS